MCGQLTESQRANIRAYITAWQLDGIKDADFNALLLCGAATLLDIIGEHALAREANRAERTLVPFPQNGEI